VDRPNQRIALGMKQLGTDPWSNIETLYKVGDLVSGKVTKLASFGAFVGLQHDIDGLVHISQVTEDHVDKIKNVLKVGQDVNARVVKIDKGERRIGLGRAMQFQDLADCHVVFVSSPARESTMDLANRLKGRPVLLVGESEGFAASGGAIQFTIEDNRVHFIINPDAADRAGLKISSKLLALAKIVRDSNRSVAGSALR